MINFRKVELEDQKAYKPYMAQQQCRSCECTFANLYLWSRFYAVTATVENGMLLTKSEEGDYLSYGFPMGKPKYLKGRWMHFMSTVKRRNASFRCTM